uniref:SJCHGC04334 protein n=1 Tax=Schistosoma japonicum TaxID=6182 RepID=Q5DAX7_SCHJA|nr:SJCHGC04334 protein [Schistosoma japonicum]
MYYFWCDSCINTNDDAIANIKEKITELEVSINESKQNLTSAHQQLAEVVDEMRFAYPEELGNINEYEYCYKQFQASVNAIKLYEIMESFKERLRRDYRKFPEEVFEKIMKHSKKLKQRSDLKQSEVENVTCDKPENINEKDVINLENSITNYQSASVYLNIFSTQNNYLIDLKKKLENLVKKHSEE